MDYSLNNQLFGNTLNFKRTLDRITEKYSKLQYEDGGLEVDLGETEWETLGHYISCSKKVLNSLESKNLTGLSEDSLSRQSDMENSQLNCTFNEDRGEKTCVSTREFGVGDNEEMMSSLNESCKTMPESELLPEDEDEELQTSLSSHGNSLVELYPSMVSRIERAWHQQYVSEAASSVLRRYRRWRQQPKRSGLNGTFNVTLRHTNRNRKMLPSKELLKESSGNPGKRVGPETTLCSVQHEEQRQQLSPVKNGPLLRRDTPHIVSVMDFSDKPREMSLNETFIVPELSPCKQLQLGERVSITTACPSQPSYVSAKPSKDSFRDIKPFVSSHLAESSSYARETPTENERSDIYGSPVRQSPFKARVMSILSRSPHGFSKSPLGHSVDRWFVESLKPRSQPMSLPCSPKRPVVQLRMLYPKDSHQASHPHSPQAARRADGHHRLRRHLSFDSLSRPVSYSPQKIDDDFTKVYHKFVCQSKSASSHSLPCRLCARSSEASRAHSSSSSSLAALALSPHRSVLWKRNRELRCDSYPQSKRLRDECGEYSPGSKRHKREMLRGYLSPSELGSPHAVFSHSPSKLRTQQPSAHQEAWMSRRHIEFTADSFNLGDSHMRKTTSGYYPW